MARKSNQNQTPASTAEVRAWAADNADLLTEKNLSTTFLTPPSGKVRGRIPGGVGALFTEVTGRPYAEKSVAEQKSITLTLTKRDKAGRSRGKVEVAVPVAQVRALGGAPERGRISSAVREKAVAALQTERGW